MKKKTKLFTMTLSPLWAKNALFLDEIRHFYNGIARFRINLDKVAKSHLYLGKEFRGIIFQIPIGVARESFKLEETTDQSGKIRIGYWIPLSWLLNMHNESARKTK